MKNTALHSYCLKLLKEFGCHRDAYRWTEADNRMYGDSLGNLETHIAEAVVDLSKDAYGCPSEGIERNDKIRKWVFSNTRWNAIEIVTELFAIGNAVREPKKDRYSVWWDNGDCSDSHEAGNSLKDAKDKVFETLLEWMSDFGKGKGSSTPEDWDYMIANCWANVHLTSDCETPDEDHNPVWEPTKNDLKRIGWIATDEMDDVTYNAIGIFCKWPRRDKKSI